jgi:hypothetical protein
MTEVPSFSAHVACNLYTRQTEAHTPIIIVKDQQSFKALSQNIRDNLLYYIVRDIERL